MFVSAVHGETKRIYYSTINITCSNCLFYSYSQILMRKSNMKLELYSELSIDVLAKISLPCITNGGTGDRISTRQ